jgi:4-amino-4-deoxy-L-arabinose transferase-like glycosyltransferase
VTGTRLALLAITAIGAALRIVLIDQAPPGLYYDEAANGIDAQYVLEGERPLFFRGNQGREPLHIYLTALATALVGPGWLAVRLPSIAAGILTVPAAYLLGREVGGRSVGVLTALLLAVSYWHVHLSRLGFRAVWVPLVVALALGLALRSWRSGRMLPAALAGLAMGLGLYTYLAARVVPLVVAALTVAAWAWLRPRPRAELLVAPLVVAAAVAAPLGAYFARHPELFWSRAEAAGGGPLGLGERLASAAGVFVWAGDIQARHNLPGRPAFDWLAGGVFLLGLALVLGRPTLPRTALLGTTAAMLLPQALASGEPHFLRAVGVLPTACAIAAVGLGAVLEGVPSRSARGLAVAALALVWGAWGARDYFVTWAPSRAAYVGLESHGREAAALLGAERPVAAASRMYRERPTALLGARCPPDAAFDANRAIVLPPGGELVVLTPSEGMPGEVAERLGAAEQVGGRWPDERGRPSIALHRVDPGALLPAREVLAMVGGVLGLERYGLAPVLRPGDGQRLEVGWRVVGPPVAARDGLYQFAHVIRPVGDAEEVWAKEDVAPFPSGAWRGGERGLTWFRLDLPADAPPGAYWVSTGLYATPGLERLPVVDASGRPAGDSLRLGPFKLWRAEDAQPRPSRWLAEFDEGVVLDGVSVPAQARPGEVVEARLRWWAEGPTAKPLTVFAHLLEGGQRERAGADGPPVSGLNPTSVWQPGERVEETRRLRLPADAPPGRYALEVGLYDPDTGIRLRLREAPERLGDGALIAWITVAP